MISFKQFLSESILLEDRNSNIAERQGPQILQAFNTDLGRKPSTNLTPLQIVTHLSQAGSKYIQWITNQYIQHNFRYEDIPQLKNDLSKFEQLTKSNSITNKDIGSYKTLAQLRDAIKQFSIAGEGYNSKLEKLYQGVNSAVKSGHGKWIYNNPNDPIKIYVPTDEEGSVCIRRAYPDISWCNTHEDDIDTLKETFAKETIEERYRKWFINSRRHSEDDRESAYEGITEEVWEEINNGEHDDEIDEYKQNMYDYYLKQFGGDFYVILTPDGPYQLHFESDQFMDENDSPIDFNQLIRKYPTIARILGPIVSKLGHPHFHPNIKEITIPEIIKALELTLKNLKFVPIQKLSIDNWVNIMLYYCNKAYVPQATFCAEIKEIIKFIRDHTDHLDIDQYVDICTKVIEQFKGNLLARSIPNDILIRMNAGLGKQKLIGYAQEVKQALY